jgi:hypothetical protein
LADFKELPLPAAMRGVCQTSSVKLSPEIPDAKGVMFSSALVEMLATCRSVSSEYAGTLVWTYQRRLHQLIDTRGILVRIHQVIPLTIGHETYAF